MSSDSKRHRGLITTTFFAFLILLCSAATSAAAQEPTHPKVEVFGGYSFFYPGADLNARNPGAPLPLKFRQESNPRGIGGSVTYNFNRWFGLTLDGSGHWGSGESGPDRVDDSSFYNLSAGPKFTYRRKHFAPFVEGLVGWHRLKNETFGGDDRFGFMVGGGIDVPLTRRFGLRLLRGDYVISNHQFPSNVPDTEVRGVRLQTGVLVMFGGDDVTLPVGANCSAQPSEIMAGEPVTATVSATNFNPKHTLTYAWSSTGGTVKGNDTTATIDTNGLAPGSYTAVARVADPRSKKTGEARCETAFSVKAPPEPPKNPPQISCSADPATVTSGQPSTISCTCTSPDNAQLQPLSWQTSSGRISGPGMKGTLDTSGAAAGAITVATTCTDVRGLSSSANTLVNVEVPQPAPTASRINECSFPNTVKPMRVDNACKAALDDVALRLQREADARAVIVGQMEDGEKSKSAAAQRAFNTRDYLVKDKQIDASRFEVRTGQDGGKRVEIYLVPNGAAFNAANTVVVTEPRTAKRK